MFKIHTIAPIISLISLMLIHLLYISYTVEVGSDFLENCGIRDK